MNFRTPLLALFLFLFLMSVLFFGCSQPQSDAPPPVPAAEPEVDKTFMDATAVEAWRADIATIIQGDAATPHPREIWRYAADFHVDRTKSDPILGDPTIWDAEKVAEPSTDLRITDAPTPRPDEALALEAQDKEWDAAQLWIVLNRLDDAKRCSAELEKEGEWKAVAMIAVHTGDLATLDRATKRMVGADQVRRTQSVASYAFEQGKIDVAKHVAHAYRWSLSEILSPYQIRGLALKGDTSILCETLDREIVAWEKNDFTGLGEYSEPQIMVADIAILAKTEPAKAKEYASRYLRLPYANVLIWTECGDGCYSVPIHGALELYQLIRADQSLRELYFARLRTAIDEMYPTTSPAERADPWNVTATIRGIEPGRYGGWREGIYNSWGAELMNGRGVGNQITAYLLRVRQMGDAELTSFWVAMLDTFPKRFSDEGALNFEREIGRCAMSLPFSQSVEAFASTEVFILDELHGGANIQMEDTWSTWDKEFPPWGYSDEATYLFRVLTRGEVSASREAVIRAELGIEQTPGEEESLRGELRDRFYRSIDAHYGENWLLESELRKAREALRTNAVAKTLRDQRNLPTIELYPDTDVEYDELMAPSLAFLCEKLPAKCQFWPRLTPHTP